MSDPVQRYEAQLIFNAINSFVINNHINFCNQAFFLGGQASDPSSIYMTSAKELKSTLADLGSQITQEVTLNANYTVKETLVGQFTFTAYAVAFLNANIWVILIFLMALVTMLLIALFLSDI